MDIQQSFDQAIVKIADAINRKRRSEAFEIYNNKESFRSAMEDRRSNAYVHGSKDKSMRKIASYPVEVDAFFERMYGKDYWKEKDFFSKYHKEWLVIDPNKL